MTSRGKAAEPVFVGYAIVLLAWTSRKAIPLQVLPSSSI